MCIDFFMLNLCTSIFLQSTRNVESNLCASNVCINYIYDFMLNGVHQVNLFVTLCQFGPVYLSLSIYIMNQICVVNWIYAHCESVCLSLWVCLHLKSKLFHILLLSQNFHNATRTPPKLQLQICFSNRNLDMDSLLVIMSKSSCNFLSSWCFPYSLPFFSFQFCCFKCRSKAWWTCNVLEWTFS